MNIQEILEKIKYNNGIFPHNEIAEIIDNRQQAVPELLKVIAYTKENIEDLVEEDNYIVHIYAMYLLAQFKEKTAYQPIIDFFSIPGEITLDITGDMVTENLSRVLASVYDGNDELLKSLIENRKANEYVRTAALDCFLVLVATDIKPREEVISYFKELYNGKLEKEFSPLPNNEWVNQKLIGL